MNYREQFEKEGGESIHIDMFNREWHNNEYVKYLEQKLNDIEKGIDHAKFLGKGNATCQYCLNEIKDKFKR